MSGVQSSLQHAFRFVVATALIATSLIVAFGSAAIAPPAAPAHAAASFVRVLGTATVASSTLTLTTTDTAQAGNSIIVAFSAQSSTSRECYDPVNGTYTNDAVSGNSTFRAALCSTHIIDSLPVGSAITVTAPSAVGVTAIAMEFSGLASSPVDRTADTGSAIQSADPGGVGPVATTSQANEVLVASVYFNIVAGGGTTPITPGTNGTANNCAETGSPTYAASTTIVQPGVSVRTAALYCTVSAPAAYIAEGGNYNSAYNMAFVTYRAALAPILTMTGPALDYAVNGAAVPIDPGLTFATNERTRFTGASVSITGGFVAAADTLSFTNQNGISGTYNPTTGVLTLTGNASLAEYQAALRSVSYTNGSGGASLGSRTVSFQATDDLAIVSNIGTRQITFSAPTATPTQTPTNTPVSTATVTPTGTLPATSVPTSTVTATTTATPTVPPVRQTQDDTDKQRAKSEAERREEQHTNKGGQHDVHTEGNVVGVERAADGNSLLVTIALGPGGDERLTIQVYCTDGQCPDVQVGDFVVADGYQNGVGDPNNHFVATDDFDVTRNGQRVP